MFCTEGKIMFESVSKWMHHSFSAFDTIRSSSCTACVPQCNPILSMQWPSIVQRNRTRNKSGSCWAVPSSGNTAWSIDKTLGENLVELFFRTGFTNREILHLWYINTTKTSEEFARSCVYSKERAAPTWSPLLEDEMQRDSEGWMEPVQGPSFFIQYAIL